MYLTVFILYLKYHTFQRRSKIRILKINPYMQ